MQIQNKEDALALKEVGNSLFKEKKYDQACEYYTRAIEKDSKSSIFFSNRARCLKMLNRFEEGYEDALRAINLDQKNIKAHLLAGQILINISESEKEPQKLEAAIEKIKRSLSLCSSQGKKQYEGYLKELINRANKKLWYLRLDRQIYRKKALRSYLIGIVEKDNTLSEELKDRYNQRIVNLLDQNIRTEKSEVPSELVCFLSKQLMKDPVCNEYGNTYCREAYLKFIQSQPVDPKSLKPLVSKVYYSNLNIRKAIQDFLEKNMWAYEQILA